MNNSDALLLEAIQEVTNPKDKVYHADLSGNLVYRICSHLKHPRSIYKSNQCYCCVVTR